MNDHDRAAVLAAVAAETQSCQLCRLCKSATRAVPGEGPADARIMFIGEAPGYHEDRQGRPFVGPAGQLLEELLATIGLARKDVYIGNVVKHRPPGNRDPLPDEIEACKPYLERQIAAINPAIIVALGRFAMAQFMPGATISQVHGRARRVNGRLFMPIIHPAAALRRPDWRKMLEEDFQSLGRAMANVPAGGMDEVSGADEVDLTAQTGGARASQTAGERAEQMSLF